VIDAEEKAIRVVKGPAITTRPHQPRARQHHDVELDAVRILCPHPEELGSLSVRQALVMVIDDLAEAPHKRRQVVHDLRPRCVGDDEA
jgi:hypothetical protein